VGLFCVVTTEAAGDGVGVFGAALGLDGALGLVVAALGFASGFAASGFASGFLSAAASFFLAFFAGTGLSAALANDGVSEHASHKANACCPIRRFNPKAMVS
jgi:hypothetical protein